MAGDGADDRGHAWSRSRVVFVLVLRPGSVGRGETEIETMTFLVDLGVVLLLWVAVAWLVAFTFATARIVWEAW